MVDLNTLKSRYGINIINANLNSGEKHVSNNLSIMSESASMKIKHLSESAFDTTQDMLSFVASNLDVDINLGCENIDSHINNMFMLFDEYGMINPHFDPTKIETWCDGLNGVMNSCHDILNQNTEIVQYGLNEDGSMDVPDSVVRENIYKDLDDNSILLLYGMLTGNFNSSYISEMRNTIYNDVSRNKNNSQVGRVVLHSLKENNVVGFGSLLESFGIEACKKVQNGKTMLFENGSSITAISRYGNNKYVVINLQAIK